MNYQAQAISKLSEKRKNLIEELQKLDNGQERILKAFGSILDTLPQKIKARARVEINHAHNFTWAYVSPKYKKFSEHDTKLITAWCASLSDRWNFTKEANGYDKTWVHQVTRGFKWNEIIRADIEFKGTSDIDGCELIEETYTETRTRYKVKC